MERQDLIISKFGGSSMATFESIRLVRQILEADLNRRIIVVSAPGISSQFDTKVTDLLLQNRVDEVCDRFAQLGQELHWNQAAERISELRRQVIKNPGYDFRISRGEWLTAQMLADITNSQFVDAADLLLINGDRTVNSESDERIQARLENVNQRIIVPGFYGLNKRGWIRTLPRDGSDTTGAVIARALEASRYEIFSDTNGVYDRDPRYFPDARNIPNLSFAEMSVIAQTAKVVQSQAVEILQGTGVSINCRNTFQPQHPGTWIS